MELRLNTRFASIWPVLRPRAAAAAPPMPFVYASKPVMM
jgi:hypothetical protein